MTTRRLPVDQMQYVMRRLGDLVRESLGCPSCSVGPWGIFPHKLIDGKPWALRVVKWRKSAVRLECPTCGLRFSVDRDRLAKLLSEDPCVQDIWRGSN